MQKHCEEIQYPVLIKALCRTSSRKLFICQIKTKTKILMQIFYLVVKLYFISLRLV